MSFSVVSRVFPLRSSFYYKQSKPADDIAVVTVGHTINCYSLTIFPHNPSFFYCQIGIEEEWSRQPNSTSLFTAGCACLSAALWPIIPKTNGRRCFSNSSKPYLQRSHHLLLRSLSFRYNKWSIQKNHSIIINYKISSSTLLCSIRRRNKDPIQSGNLLDLCFFKDCDVTGRQRKTASTWFPALPFNPP